MLLTAAERLGADLDEPGGVGPSVLRGGSIARTAKDCDTHRSLLADAVTFVGPLGWANHADAYRSIATTV